eukprot:6175206-Pleurochrysis_carterae.AAC.2
MPGDSPTHAWHRLDMRHQCNGASHGAHYCTAMRKAPCAWQTILVGGEGSLQRTLSDIIHMCAAERSNQHTCGR